MIVVPRDFVPRGWSDSEPVPDPPADPEEAHRAGWVPTRFLVSEESEPFRDAEFGTNRIGEDLEGEGFSAAEVEEIREEVDRWLRPPRKLVELPVGAELHEIVDIVGDVLTEQNDPPRIFRRQGTLVRFDLDEADQPVFRLLKGRVLQVELSRMARWMVRAGDEVETVDPPNKGRVVLDDPPRKVPVSVGIVEAPVMRPDGTLLREEGYDRATRLVYRRPPGLRPTRYRSREEALEQILDMVRDFPFAEPRQANLANYFAWLLSPALRPVIGEAPTPAALFEAPTPGTGKDLLASTAPLVYTGGAAAARPLPSSEDEVRKELVAALMGGRTLLVYTNVSGRLSSDALAGIVTSTRWSGRKLGESLDLTFGVQLTVGLTANNLALGRDWPRRVYRIRLDAGRARPWERADFTHPDLPAWVLEHRNDLLGAVLYLCESWARAGMREAAVEWSSYSRWARVVGGVLEHAGVSGFLANRDETPEDPAEEQWAALFAAWHGEIGEEWVPVADVVGRLPISLEWPEEVLTANGALPENAAQRLGVALNARRDTVTADGLRVERRPGRQTRWRVVKR